jgi:ketosteroid isomerase-like protein
MKKILFVMLVFAASFVQVAQAQNEDEKTISTIRKLDSLFWAAYNKCDLPGMMKYVEDDVEFYHDKGGETHGGANLIESIRKGLCSNDSFRLRRAEVKGTVKVYPLHKNGDVVYGAIISGQHHFYHNTLGKPETLEGLARFMQLWILKDGVWKMHRILSYDHGPAGRKMD